MINYSKLVEYIKSRKRFECIVKYSNKVLTLLNYVSYPLFLIIAWYLRADRLLWYVFVPAVSFMGLSVFRHIYNAPRPYEKFGYQPIGKENPKSGKSFPSRHVFSAFIIGFMIFDFCLPIGTVFLVLACLLGVIRVVSGIHFVKDIVAGAVFAVASYLVMIFFA